MQQPCWGGGKPPAALDEAFCVCREVQGMFRVLPVCAQGGGASLIILDLRGCGDPLRNDVQTASEATLNSRCRCTTQRRCSLAL